jgi:4-hydroxyphenylpyruvate dioxygenase
MSTVLHREIAPSAKNDFLPLNGTDHVELYVGNARHAAYFYRMAFGMSWVAYAGPETGVRDHASFVLEQGKVRLVLTTPLRPDTEVAEHVHLHGDGVRDVALWVDDARRAWRETTKRGARSVREPFELKDAHGSAKMASIAAYGDTIHTFVERHNYHGAFLPGYQEVQYDPLARPTGLVHVEHVVGNVGWNEMNRWVNFYADVMGFSVYQHFAAKDMSTEYSAPKVMANGDGRVKFPIHEPAEGGKKSQAQQYLEFYHGPGVQHIALATTDILYTVSTMKDRGVEFLHVPHHYYSELQGRVGRIDEPVSELERLGILVDRDNEGYMLQIFTRPVEDRPTLSFEIIQRKGSRGFGERNFKALFDETEGEQR